MDQQCRRFLCTRIRQNPDHHSPFKFRRFIALDELLQLFQKRGVRFSVPQSVLQQIANRTLLPEIVLHSASIEEMLKNR